MLLGSPFVNHKCGKFYQLFVLKTRLILFDFCSIVWSPLFDNNNPNLSHFASVRALVNECFVLFHQLLNAQSHHGVPISTSIHSCFWVMCYSLFTSCALFIWLLNTVDTHSYIYNYKFILYVVRNGVHAHRYTAHKIQYREKNLNMFTLKPNVNRNNALNSQHPFGIQIEFHIYSIYVFKLILLFVTILIYMYLLFFPLSSFYHFLVFASNVMGINRDICMYWNFDRQFICTTYMFNAYLYTQYGCRL